MLPWAFPRRESAPQDGMTFEASRARQALFELFLDELGKYLWSYEVQSRPWAFDVRDVEDWGAGSPGRDPGLVITADNVQSFFRLLSKKSNMTTCSALAESPLEPHMLEQLNQLLTEALRQEAVVSRRGGKVVVKGVCVVLSNVLDRISEEVKNYSTPVAVWLLAQDTVFIDCRWDAGPLKVAVVAPHWHVVERPKKAKPESPAIVLNGKSVKKSSKPAKAGIPARVPGLGGPGSRASMCANVSLTDVGDATLPPSRMGSCGAHGQAGGAGQAAGSFFGVAMDIVDGHLLTVSVCGGDGAAGQEGGAGGDGEDGQDAVGAYLSPHQASGLGDVTSVVTLFYNQRSRKFFGSAGGRGGQGGDGGRGGAGGRAGEVTVLSPRPFTEDSGVRVLAQDGRPGEGGLGGRGGKGGKDGKDCTAILHWALFVPVAVTTTYPGTPATYAANGDIGTKGADAPRKAKPAQTFKEEEKDAVMGEFVAAFKDTPPPRTLPSSRRETCAELAELLRLAASAEGGWRRGHWYCLSRTNRAP